MDAWRGHRHIVVSVIAAMLLTAGMLMPGHEASASASGCVLSENQPRSCVRVRGAGTFVEWAQGGVGLFSFSSVYGHFQVYGADFDVSTPDEVYSNRQPQGERQVGSPDRREPRPAERKHGVRHLLGA
jgi:hypothetical protein